MPSQRLIAAVTTVAYLILVGTFGYGCVPKETEQTQQPAKIEKIENTEKPDRSDSSEKAEKP